MNDILLVDDDDNIRELMCEMLADEGYAVVGAVDGSDALRHLQATPVLPRLILLDLMMPVMDGWQFLLAQQRDSRLAAIPVVVFSATNHLEQVAPRAAAAYLPKPFEITALLALVERYCGVPCQPRAASYA